LEALSGQLYLVTIVAMLVARMATTGMSRLRDREDAPAAPPDQE
jgi:hypothetical protein